MPSPRIIKVFAGVFARGGSEGLPNKNLAIVGGETLVWRAVKAAMRAPEVETVFCSTDSDLIAVEAARAGAEVPFRRPPGLAQSDSAEFDAWVHLAQFLLHREAVTEDSIFLIVSPVCPLRSTGDLVRVINAVVENRGTAVATYSNSLDDGDFTRVTLEKDGSLRRARHGEGKPPSRRQDVPHGLSLRAVAYAAPVSYFLSGESFWSGTVKGVFVEQENAIDIDSSYDLKVARLLLRDRQFFKAPVI